MIDPETELWLINRRHEELRRQAAQDGLARLARRSRPGGDRGVLARLAALVRRAPDVVGAGSSEVPRGTEKGA